MKPILGVLLALGLLALLPANSYADEFGLDWTGAYGTGSIVVTAANEGGGQFTITSLSGTQGGLGITLLSPNAYGENNNSFYPTGSALVDDYGFAFTDGKKSYDIFFPIQSLLNLSGAIANTYYECSSEGGDTCIGYAPTVGQPLTSFADPVPTPEPSQLLLLAVGFAGLIGFALCCKRPTPLRATN